MAKHLFRLWLCLFALPSFAGNIICTNADFTGNPQSLRVIYVFYLDAPTSTGTNIITRDRLRYTNDSTGYFVVTNYYPGNYRFEFQGTFTTTTNWFNFPATNGTVNAFDPQWGSGPTNGIVLALTRAAGDARYVAKTNGIADNLRLTGGALRLSDAADDWWVNWEAPQNYLIISNRGDFGYLEISSDGVVTASSQFTAPSFIGSGSALTALNASQLTSGTVPRAQLSNAVTNSAVVYVYTNGTAWGPDGPINTAGTVTCGINEAQHALLAAVTGSSISNGPPGGGSLIFQSGIYPCTGQVLYSNCFPNPIIWQGVQSGPSPGTMIKYGGRTNFFQTTAPSGHGMLSLWLQNLTVTSEAVTTNRLFRLNDVYQLRADHCQFSGWGFFTNVNTFSGFIGNQTPEQGAGLVAFETGDPPNDYSAGVVEFNDCRFWGLASGVATTTDHQFVTDCSFALIGGANKDAPSTNMWPLGTVYHYPESCYALHPGWINNSSGGDVLFRGRWSAFNTQVGLLNCKASTLGNGPTLIVDSSAQLESAAYLVLQYDDIPAQQINIYSPASAVARSGISTVTKPGTITHIIPKNARFGRFGTETLGDTNLVYFAKGEAAILNQTPFYPDVNAFPSTLCEIGDVGGRNIVRGNTYVDKLNVGVSVDLSHCTVAGGTDSGINGTYAVRGRVLVGGFTSLLWTNATYALLQDDADSLYGGIFLKADTSFTSELYYNATPTVLGSDLHIAAAGNYDADAGSGTPPVVTFPMVTNTARFFGGAAIDGTITGNGAGITNIQGAWRTNGNSGTDPQSFVGTTDATDFKVKAGGSLVGYFDTNNSVWFGKFNTNLGTANFIGGGLSNSIGVSGGANGSYNTIQGGLFNSIGTHQLYDFIGGGFNNVISNNASDGGVSAIFAGQNNSLGNGCLNTSILWGNNNQAYNTAISGAAGGSYAVVTNQGAVVFKDGNSNIRGSSRNHALTLAFSGGVDVIDGPLVVSNTASVKAGSGGQANVGGDLKVNTTTTGNVAGGEDNLITYSVPASTLSANGQYIEYDCWGYFTNNANAKDLKIYFGSTAIFDSTALVLNGVAWRGHGKVVRTGAATQTATCEFTIGGTLLGAVTTTTTQLSAPAETLSGAVTFKVTGTDSGVSPVDNSIVQVAEVIKWGPGQ